MKYAFSLLAFILMVTSCQEKKSDPLYDEVMEIHDRVMPRMSEISKLTMELKAKRELLSDSALIANYDQRIKALDAAEQAMFTWMNEFRMPEENESRKAYLESEKKKIQQVRDMMTNSIDNAQKILQTQ